MRKVIVKGSWVLAAAVAAHVSASPIGQVANIALVASDAQPTARSVALMAEGSQPKGPLMAEGSQPKGPLMAEGSQPKGPLSIALNPALA
jgi:hypothetical protein